MSALSMVKQLPVLLLCGSVGALAGPEFNIDFGDLSTDTPASYAAASGQGGTWNIIDALGNTPLVDTTGAATGATLAINKADGFGSDGNYSGPNEDLLEDQLWGNGNDPQESDWSITISGLPVEEYIVYYYAPAHPMPTGEILINNMPVPSLPGDSLNALLQKGTNWDALPGVQMPGGVLRITGTNSDALQFAGLGGIAGLQLVQRDRALVDPPRPGC